MKKKILAWVCVLAMLIPLTASGIEAFSASGKDTAIHSAEVELPEEAIGNLDPIEEQPDLDETEAPSGDDVLIDEQLSSEDDHLFTEENPTALQISPLSVGTTGELVRNTLAAWAFTGTKEIDTFYATHGELNAAAYIFAHTDRIITSSKVSIGEHDYTGTVYCGNWSVSHNRWGIRFSTVGHENISLTFASYGVNGAPRNFRVETENGTVLTQFESGRGNSLGEYTRVNLTLPSSYNNKAVASVYIIQEGIVSVSGGTVQPGSASNSRIGDIAISGDGAEPIDPKLAGSIATWQFTSADQFDENLIARATDGAFSDSALRIVGAGSNLTAGIMSSVGQIYCGGWNNASLTNERSWLISTSSECFEATSISFSACSSATGPKNFILELNNNGEWDDIARYTLTTTLRKFTFDLPAVADNRSNLEIRLRVADTVAVGGGAVQSGGTSRIYNVMITGSLVPPDGTTVFNLQLPVTSGANYLVPISADNMATFDAVFTITYQPTEVQLLDFAAQTNGDSTMPGSISNTPLTIISHSSGKIVFKFEKGISAGYTWSGVISVLKFRALKTATTTFAINS